MKYSIEWKDFIPVHWGEKYCTIYIAIKCIDVNFNSRKGKTKSLIKSLCETRKIIIIGRKKKHIMIYVIPSVSSLR